MRLILFCGGPYAGRVIKYHEWPPTFVMIVPHKPMLAIGSEDERLDFTTDKNRIEYRAGSATSTVAGEVRAYHFVGEDKYRTAKTFEHMVPFAAPYSLQEIHDRETVEHLINESRLWL